MFYIFFCFSASFTAKMEGIINGDSDGGFCRLNAAPAQQTPCLALMSEMVNKLQAWAEMSSPRVVLPTGTPVSIAETVCDKQYPATEEQRAECGRLFKSFGEKLYAVTAGKMGNKPQPPPAATMAAAPAPKSPCCETPCCEKPKCPCPAAAAAAPAAATGPAPKKEVKPESTGPDSTNKARALCDEVPEDNVEHCKKFISNAPTHLSPLGSSFVTHPLPPCWLHRRLLDLWVVGRPPVLSFLTHALTPSPVLFLAHCSQDEV